jgi:purine-binding chemotaxis protein CheW
MIVVENETLVVGFVVDSVSEAMRIPASEIQPPPPTVAGLDSSYIDGVGKFDDRLLILLNLDTLFDNSELKALSAG